ncbi:hypothetical protein CONLIGDRAFT_644416 [Coniochaeta ligniaria NRRL 30616]|uniref:Uncharacterized protein n=1 Tax=Coniochaeta ligniaria NRRL 30616 TaxID=1408157 RepID=A0A1J7JG37_9PEZI|nr:hypothetical protein CONLIGDRAFT_644416 [Coniochaeta ligniaria NRRL 30616]
MSYLVRTPKPSCLAKSASIALASQAPALNHRHHVSYQARRPSSTSQQAAGAAENASTTRTAQAAKNQPGQQATSPHKPLIKKKTMAELDEELRLKLEGISGDGGASGVEYENGKAQGLKRNVKANMFRVI